MVDIVISYRRNDTTKWIARILFERIQIHFGEGSAFIDVDSVPIGKDFRQHLRSTLEKCDVLLALVGPNWREKDQTGKDRLSDDTDWVRAEIRTALQRNIFVVPVLVEGARMPKVEELPPDLHDFAYRHATTLDSENYEKQVSRLFQSLDKQLSPPRPGMTVRSRKYLDQIDHLAHDTGSELRSKSPLHQHSRPAVFLAEVMDDLQALREELRRYLQHADIAVFPDAPYRGKRDEFEKLASDISRSTLFVQLLGNSPGPRSKDVPEGLDVLQYGIAQRDGIEILQWRGVHTDPLGDNSWLLKLDTVHCGSLEQLIQECLTRLRIVGSKI